jgi:polysaccharide export outer membrane protein
MNQARHDYLPALVGALLLALPCAAGCHHALVGPCPAYPEVPRELSKVTLPPYVIEPPDILLINAVPALPEQPIAGQHLVRPDGTVGLGIYGSVYVAGLTLDEARDAIQVHLSSRIKNVQVSVDVFAYNSKVYYVITDGGGFGEQVYSFPVKGSETVLDALGQINGLPAVASKRHIWLARRAPDATCGEQILPVDWKAITQKGIAATNYQVLPGDRIYVKADSLIAADSFLAKCISPIERLFGVTLLGSTTYNSIAAGSGGIQNTGGGGF